MQYIGATRNPGETKQFVSVSSLSLQEAKTTFPFYYHNDLDTYLA